MSTGGYWWHATGPTASGATNAVATPATVSAIGATPTATKLASAKTLFDAPSVAAINIDDVSITLLWGPTFGASSYDIERNGTIISTNWPHTTFEDTGLTPSTTYRYRVRAKP